LVLSFSEPKMRGLLAHLDGCSAKDDGVRVVRVVCCIKEDFFQG
jgi:hypothetical protein